MSPAILAVGFLLAARPAVASGVPASGATDPPAAQPAPDAAARVDADALARCAAAYTMQGRLRNVTTGKPAAGRDLLGRAEWFLDLATQQAGQEYATARFKAHYAHFMEANDTLARMDPKAEPEKAQAIVQRFLAELNAALDDCDGSLVPGRSPPGLQPRGDAAVPAGPGPSGAPAAPAATAR